MPLSQSTLNIFRTQISNGDLSAVTDYYEYLGNNGIEYGDLAKQVGETGYYGDVAENYFYDKAEEFQRKSVS